MTNPFHCIQALLAEQAAREQAAICPRCKGALVHDFEDGCWTQDRCTECGATWFNDPPRLAKDAPHFIRLGDLPRVRRALEVALRQRDLMAKIAGMQNELDDDNAEILDALEGKS